MLCCCRHHKKLPCPYIKIALMSTYEEKLPYKMRLTAMLWCCRDQKAQLMSRHWVIENDKGKVVDEVRDVGMSVLHGAAVGLDFVHFISPACNFGM